MTSLLTNVAVAASTTLALALFLVAAISYRRDRTARLLLVTAAFALFLLKGLALSVALFLTDDAARLLAPAQAFDALVLLALYVALVKR